jgi:SAM-dependent methyltransferase
MRLRTAFKRAPHDRSGSALSRLLRPFASAGRDAGGAAVTAPTHDYARRVDSEKAYFSGNPHAHELPPIYGYWSNKYLRPILQSFGYATPDEMFARHFVTAYDASPESHRTFVSLGTGDCATEVWIAQQLAATGREDFTIECVELNDGLVSAGRALADQHGLGHAIVPVQTDLNTWKPARRYDGVLANNSLHHIVNLEGLLDGVRASLRSSGTFVTSDMIGRNGHMRWPEALALVHEFWRELPHAYRYNHQLSRHEELYDNWDCSSEGFEGIRAQDILRLLIERFDFDLFVPFANVIDPFIERSFGHNFDVQREFDVAFIDRVHARDAEEIARGAIKPTHIVAAMCVGRPGQNRWPPGLTPRFSVRDPDVPPAAYRAAGSSADDAQAATTDDSGRDPHAAPPAIDYSDLWSDPTAPGWGISIHQHANRALMANLVVHDDAGRPVWYSIQPGGWRDDRTFFGRVFSVAAPASAQSVSFAGGAPREAGHVTLDFDDASTATLTYDIDGRSGTRRIRRMEY